VPQIEAHPGQYFRQVFFICDEYQHFATVGENEPTGDESSSAFTSGEVHSDHRHAEHQLAEVFIAR